MNSEQRLLVYGPVIVENVDVWAELKIDYRHCCLYHWEKMHARCWKKHCKNIYGDEENVFRFI